MKDEPSRSTRLLNRRSLLGGSMAAASVAVAYAALGDKLDLLGGRPGSDTSSETAPLKSEQVKISHLLRRASFGVTSEEFQHYQSIGLDATIDELLNFRNVDDSAAEALANAVSIESSPLTGLSLRWLTRMANTKRPLQEKMTLFWHGHLTSQFSVVRDPAAMQRQNDLFRTMAMDRFPAILKAMTRDSAMSVYLDIAGSSRRAPNENYARELMELFALGVDNFTEQDVREAARAFTGWQVPRTRGTGNTIILQEPMFQAARFDPGVKTVLGQQGTFDADDIVDIVVQQPASATFIVGKLFSFFVYPNPEPETLRPFVETYLRSEMSIGATVEALFRSEVMHSPRAYRAIVRSPVEYIVAAVKALGGTESVAQTLGQGRGRQTLSSLGQTLFEPPNVAGWPGGHTWLNSATMFARLNALNFLTGGSQPVQGRRTSSQPAANGQDLGTASQALSHYLPMLLDDNVPDEARQLMLDYAGGPDARLTPDRLRGLVYLILASPQFHLA